MNSKQLNTAQAEFDKKPVPPNTGSAVKYRRVALALISLMAVIALQRYHTRNEPLERDMPTYAVVAHEMLDGRALYSDVFDQKPPAVYVTYAIAEKAFGYGQPAIELLGLAAAWITLFGVFAAALSLTRGSTTCALVAAATWVLIGSDLHLQANQPNTEVFMNACMVWVITIIARHLPKAPGISASICIGALTALATFYKPVVVVAPLCVCFGIVAYCWTERNAPNTRAAFASVAIVIGTVVVSWLLAAVYFRIENRFDDFYYAMVSYNRSYSGSILHNLLSSLQPRKIFPRGSQIWMYPTLFVLVICSVYGLRQRGMWIIIISYAVGTHAAVALPGRFFAHYYQLWLPVLSIGAGCAFSFLSQTNELPYRIMIQASVAALVICICAREAWSYTLSADEWSRQKYGGECIDARWVGEHINLWLTPAENYYDAGIDPQFYFYSKRRILSGVFYSDAITGKPRARAFANRVLADLQAHPPDLVTTDQFTGHIDPEVQEWLNAGYSRVSVPGHDQFFGFLVRRGSSVESRWSRLMQVGDSNSIADPRQPGK